MISPVPTFHGAARLFSQDDCAECGICWWVYDPAEGDSVWSISPGTAFADLPDCWRCPRCDASQDKFMRLSFA